MLLRTEQRAEKQRKAGSVQICTVSAFGREGKFPSMTLIFSVKYEPLSVAGVQVPRGEDKAWGSHSGELENGCTRE